VPADNAEAEKLAAALEEPSFRTSFVSNPGQALSGKNIDGGKIQDLIDALSDASETQLEFVAGLRDALRSGGYTDRVKARLV
jgi:hypothetical protein